MSRMFAWLKSGILAGILIVMNVVFLYAAENPPATEKTEKEAVVSGDVYTLSTCPVSGEKLGTMGEPVKYDYKGREIRLCCSGCIASFEKEPQKYFDQIDKAMIEDQLSHYPLETCMVSGKKLQGAMGEPINLIYKNRLVRLCCPACKEGLAKDPEGYIRKLDEAVIEKQKEKYPLEICVVSGEKISAMEKPVDIVIANRLLRLCCPDCQKAIEKDPLTYLSKVESKPETKAQKSEQK